MQLLVTGGRGSLSHTLLSQLLDHGHRVVLLGAREHPHPRVICVRELASAQVDFRTLDAVVDLAGPAPRETLDMRQTKYWLEQTRQILHRSLLTGISKYIQVSSYRAPGRNLPFFLLKSQQEQLIKESGLPYLIFRAPWIVGPSDQFLTPLIRTIQSSHALDLDHLDQVPVPMVTQEELASALITGLHLRLNVSRIYEIASLSPPILVDLVQDIAYLMGKEISVTSSRTGASPLPWSQPLKDLLRARMAGTATAYYMDFQRVEQRPESMYMEILRHRLATSS